jgi:uncharacterized membrane protein
MAGDEDRPDASSGPQDDRPAHRGFRGIEGEDLGRILALSDGVFAFAMTLLALSLTVPIVTGSTAVQLNGRLGAALEQDWTAFLGYAFAFVMIALWWVAHNRVFNYVRRYNSTLVWINMALLVQIAVMPFVLSVFVHYSGGSISQPPLMVAVDLFAGTQVTLGITNTGMWDYARRAKLLTAKVPVSVLTYYHRRGYLTSAVFAGSIAISFVNATAAELSWVLVFVVARTLGRYVD